MNLVLLGASSFTSVEPALIFWQLVTFLIVLVILRAKAWKPILGVVEEREKQIQNAIDSAKRERAEAEKLLSEQKAAISEARREAADMMRKNQADMERFRDETMAKAKKDADDAKMSALREINEQKKKAIAEVKTEAVTLAIDIAQKLLSEKMDEPRSRQLAEQYLDALPKQMGAARV